jgi:hypothetical protein
MRLIVTITRADEVRRVKSRFSRSVILRVFPHNPSTPAVRGARMGRKALADIAGSPALEGRLRRCMTDDDAFPLVLHRPPVLYLKMSRVQASRASRAKASRAGSAPAEVSRDTFNQPQLDH